MYIQGHITTLENKINANKHQKGPIGYTMPTKLDNAYSQMQQIQKKISLQIQRIAFPEIRSLIITFMRAYKENKNQINDFLATQYNQSDQLKKLDEKLRVKLQMAHHRLLKLECIKKNIQKIGNLKGLLRQKQQKLLNKQLSIQFQKRQLIQKQYQNEKRQIEKQIQQKQIKRFNLDKKIQNAQRSDTQLLNQYMNKDIAFDKEYLLQKTNQIQQIQLKQDKQIFDLFQKLAKDFYAKNIVFQQYKYTTTQLNQFAIQLQKVIPIIWKSESIFEFEKVQRKSNFINTLLENINLLSNDLIKCIKQGQKCLYFFRDFIKCSNHIINQNISTDFNEIQQKLKKQILNLDENQIKIIKNVYLQLKWLQQLSQILKQQQQSTKIISKVQLQYKSFVQKYTDIREINNCKSKLKDYYILIQYEQKYFTKHLQVNCNLIVFYKYSQQYSDFFNNVASRGYFKQMFHKKVKPLTQAVKFNNEEYKQLYQRACRSDSSKLKKKEVTQYMRKFQTYLQDNLQNNLKYFHHLIHSLSRIMALCDN